MPENYKLPGTRYLDVHWRGWVSLLGSFTIYILLGYVYTWAFISGQVVSHFYYEGDKELKEIDGLPVFGHFLLAIAIFNMLGPIFFKILNIKLLILVGLGILCICLANMANYVKKFAMFQFFMIGGMGLGMGLVYTSLMMSAWQWFGERKGLASGILMAGYALGPLVQSKIALAVLGDGKNGKDGFYPAKTADLVPKMFNTLLVLWIGILIFSVILVSENPEVKINQQKSAGKENTTAPPENKVTIKEAISSKSFWMIWFMCFFGVAFGIWTSGAFEIFNKIDPKDPKSGGLPSSALALAGQLGFIFNAIGRFGFGALNDKIGFKKTYFIVMVLQLAISLVIVPTRNSKFAYIGCVCAGLACEGAHFALYPALCAQMFGKVNSGQIFTLIFLSIPISANVIIAVFKNMVKAGHKFDIVYVFAALAILNMVLIFLFDQTPLIDESVTTVKFNELATDTYKKDVNVSQSNSEESSMIMSHNGANQDV